MTRVQWRFSLAPGVTVNYDRDTGDFYANIGGWVVETLGGNLIVREPRRPVNETPLLRVPLRDA